MFCPECRQVLKVVEEKAFSALLCGSCGGVFYPKGEFYKHLQLVKTRPMKELAAGDAGERSRAPVQAEELSAACPGCGAPLMEIVAAWRGSMPEGSKSRWVIVPS